VAEYVEELVELLQPPPPMYEMVMVDASVDTLNSDEVITTKAIVRYLISPP
jgi:hypothetical protein